MAIQITSTANAATHGLKILVYGQAGAGKTVLCRTMPGKKIIISAESGLLSLRGEDIPVIEVKSLSVLTEAFNYLNSPEGQQYDWIALDSLSEIAEAVLANELKNAKHAMQAYGETQTKMLQTIRAFRDLPGRNVYMSAKMERQKDEATGAVLYAPSMPGNKLAQQIPYLFDFVFALRSERDQQGVTQRWMQTMQDIQYMAKDRSGSLEPYELPDLAVINSKITGV
ncbi:ATP-binding protein [Magnetococcus sp. PR-3]|uniref:ATP-binding protein n=1 Tax=Magnetococcus sp. PR-3 TaxID=3120355 RepID=UPI002FCE2D96